MPISKSGLLLIERVDLISWTTVEGVLFGLSFALYISCARSLYLQLEDRDRRRQHLFTLLYMSLVMALALVEVAIDAQTMLTSYVDHADYPLGGYVYAHFIFAKSPVAIVSYVVAALFTLMLSGIQIWRLWIIWRVSRYSFFVVVFPALSLLTYLGFEVASIVLLARSELTQRLLAELFFYGITTPPLCISVAVTIPIITRILFVRRKNMKMMGQTDITNPYMSIVSMLIESFALEFVWLVVQVSIASLASSSLNPAIIAANVFFTGTQPVIQLLAYLLVIHRVTAGRGWKEDTAEKLTTLQWNRDGLQTTQISTRASIPITPEEA